jgi:transcriptional regulator with XRE-family HTH domain
MAIKDRIRQLRQEKTWSQSQLIQKMGIHRKQVSAYERFRNITSTEVLLKFADIFDVSLDFLAFEAEDKPAKVDSKGRELLRKFEEIHKFSEMDRGTIKEILDIFIQKNKFQSLAVPKEL